MALPTCFPPGVPIWYTPTYEPLFLRRRASGSRASVGWGGAASARHFSPSPEPRAGPGRVTVSVAAPAPRESAEKVLTRGVEIPLGRQGLRCSVKHSPTARWCSTRARVGAVGHTTPPGVCLWRAPPLPAL